ncbi:tRNA pseudouridine(13) synthase TruD [Helicobacter sp. MIT 21-1697]|uniref:tRNA pseudouridine(13) synthase TruD n=1 Tax=Helicobacter sp. MIT 21-1697 TaxID=2993733 RepID=UPI00224AE4DA|nr:tRNA pseudouridine(13) synthase TruD [Helicobacter sp. MIT 21-1697]MCX2717525.1 tRNA pseudouridine(13) synthase TruD [Helicobacter sp. MIT 21-1697]
MSLHSHTFENTFRIYPFTHTPIECHFNASPRDFVIKEMPLYEPSGSGEHLLLYVRKKGLSTFELLKILSNTLGCRVRDIGYAGLKDKAATSYQYLSIPRSLHNRIESALSYLSTQHIKILTLTPHNHKLKIGHLKGNSFFIRLKKVSPNNATKLHSILGLLAQSGFPNYFGNQRFGKEGDNFQSGKAISEHKLTLKNKKISNFLISSYQSHLFNAWLSSRIQLTQILRSFKPNEVLQALQSPNFPALHTFAHSCTSKLIQSLQSQKQPFVILQGDIMCHYPFGKNFVCEDTAIESTRFLQKHIAPTGALCGTKFTHSEHLAFDIEKQFLDLHIQANGTRRYAWVWAEDIEGQYIPQEAHFELHFYLPKGSYATIFLESLLGNHS